MKTLTSDLFLPLSFSVYPLLYLQVVMEIWVVMEVDSILILDFRYFIE